MSQQAYFDPKRFHTSLGSLSDALRRRKQILVLDAGISEPAGLPFWDKLVVPLREKLGFPETEQGSFGPAKMNSVQALTI